MNSRVSVSTSPRTWAPHCEGQAVEMETIIRDTRARGRRRASRRRRAAGWARRRKALASESQRDSA
jgi:hypothetical protein